MSADNIADAIASKVESAFQQLAEDVLEDLRERINVAVVRVGSEVRRSLPGEPPRRETGEYRDGFQALTVREGDQISSTVSNPNANGLDNWLENGTKKMQPRPHLRPTYDDWKPRVPDRVGITLRSNLTP